MAGSRRRGKRRPGAPGPEWSRGHRRTHVPSSWRPATLRHIQVHSVTPPGPLCRQAGRSGGHGPPCQVHALAVVPIGCVVVGGGVAPAAIRLARENAGLTQHQLARLVGVAGGERVSRWELGTSEPRPEVLVRVAKVLGVPPGDLLDVGGEIPDLRALRFAAGLSADQVAARAHVSKATYLRWETGRWKRPLSEKSVKDLARALKVSRRAALAALDQSRLVGCGHSPEA